MSLWAFLAIALSAIAHVCWNFLAKRAGGAPVFFARLQIAGAMIALPIGIVSSFSRPPQFAGLLLAGVSGICYLGYYSFMGWSYRLGSLSFAYPVARGVAPAAAAFVGVLAMGETLTLGGAIGIGLVCAGVILVGIDEKLGKPKIGLVGLVFAVATGLCSAGYMVVDKWGAVLADPSLYMACSFAVGGLLQTLLVRKAQPANSLRWSNPVVWKAAAACAGGYLAVLWVMRFEPVSLVAPLRSLSVVLSVVVGAKWLDEPGTPSRYLGAVIITLGIASLSLF